jgi:two-component system CitB family sensor kinase
MRRRHQLSTQILASVVGILLASTVVGFVLVRLNQGAELEREYEQRALAVATTFAAMPSIRRAMADPTPSARRQIQSVANQVVSDRVASFVVVIDRHGVRYSHPNRRLIGQRITEPVVALDGGNHLRIDPSAPGGAGPSANARVPLRAPGSNAIIGEVSAGIVESKVSSQLLQELPLLLLYFACALAIGVVASLTLARRLKRSTFGLELDEIAALAARNPRRRDHV